MGMVKGDAELKIFHSMLKYNNLFVAQNLSRNVIAFMGDLPLEGRAWSARNGSWDYQTIGTEDPSWFHVILYGVQ